MARPLKKAATTAEQIQEAVITPENLMDPLWVRTRIAAIRNAERCGSTSSINAKRMIDGLLSDYEDLTGEPLADARRRDTPVLERLADESLLEQSAADLDRMEAALKLAVMPDVKKKIRWLELIARVRAIQKAATESAIAFWTYVGRDQETGDVFKMGDVHRKYFEVWSDHSVPNNLISAPPGHAKSTSLVGQILWWIREDPTQRILGLFDDKTKATKLGPVLKQYIRSKLFQALAPGVHIVSRVNGTRVAESNIQFSVGRDNISREPTVELGGTTGRINGNGYDRIILDDPCPPEVQSQASVRDNINFLFDNVIEKRLRNPAKSNIHVICNLWHADDLAGHIISQVRLGRRSGWRIAVDEFRINDDSDGNPISIWPQRFNSGYYASTRATMRKADYDRLYRLICTPDDEKIVKALIYYPADAADPAFQQINPELAGAYRERQDVIRKSEQWLSIDPSATAGKSSTETAVTQLALTMAGQCYVVDAWFFPGNPVEMQDWIFNKIKAGGIHHILCEAQGGMVGQVALWKEYITKRIREENIRWTGSWHECKTRHGTGVNVGKRQRLLNVAAYIEKGYLKFPGRMKIVSGASIVDGTSRIVQFVSGLNERVQKLAQQLLNFPSGANDGVDTISQFLFYNESRILIEKASTTVTTQHRSIFADGMAAAMKALRTPADETDLGEESKWMAERF